jgi:hypothetical protein
LEYPHGKAYKSLKHNKYPTTMQVSSATPTPTPTPNPKPKPAPTPIPPAPVDEDIFIDNKLWYSLKLYVFDAEKGNHL